METKKARVLRGLLYADVAATDLALSLLTVYVLASWISYSRIEFGFLMALLVSVGLIGLLGLAACLSRRLHALQIVAAVGLWLLYLATTDIVYVLNHQPLLLGAILLNAVVAFVLSAAIHKAERA